MLAVDFSLVAGEAAGVGEAIYFLAAWFFADVGSVMLVHVFTMDQR